MGQTTDLDKKVKKKLKTDLPTPTWRKLKPGENPDLKPNEILSDIKWKVYDE